MEFSIFNEAANFTVYCWMSLSPDPWTSPNTTTARCGEEKYSSSVYPPNTERVGLIWTDINFDPENWDLSFNQTWYCEEPGTLQP